DLTCRRRDTISSTGYVLTSTATNGWITINNTTGAPGEVSLTASPITGYKFIGWSGDLSGKESVDNITLDRDKAVTANFELITYSISTATENGHIAFEPQAESYLPGTEVIVTAIGDLGYGFDSWGGDLSGTENSTTIVMDGDKSISASFTEVPTYTINVNSQYGLVVLDPPGGEYNPGTVVRLIPEADLGYYFEQWSGDLSGYDNPATITVDTNKSVNARFVYAGYGETSDAINFGGLDFEATDGTSYTGNVTGATYSTTASIEGTEDDILYQSERYGNFSIDIPVVNGSYKIVLMFAEIYHSSAGSRVFNVSIEGQQVISNLDIYAKVGENTAYNETYDMTITDGEINIVFESIINNAKISAIKINSNVFGGESFELTIDNPSNGVIEADPSIGAYPGGSNVLLNAIPDPGFMFTEWSGDLSGSQNPMVLYMDAHKNVSASFVATNWYTLTTSAANGTISVDPGEGLYGYVEGTEVSLTAFPNSGYLFNGWSGDISGTDNPANIVMDSNISV
ncbi:MAG: InlB B-repeat-containing protein, partial [Bacteroidales bacterium]